jgi:hypothetical protein
MSNDKNDKLLHAFKALRENVRHIWHNTEGKTFPGIKQAIQQAEEKASELSELGKEEWEKLSDYVKRDIQDAAEILAENGEQLSNWLEFDSKFFESSFSDWVAQVADPTRLELEQLANTARMVGEWHTGEITGVGTLKCQSCGEILHFEDAGHIPPCPKCHHTVFKKEYT